MKTNEETKIQPLEVDIALIDFDPKNRKEHDGEALKSLAASINAEGLLEPLVIRMHPQKPGRYMLVAGERRLRALQMNKATRVRVTLLSAESEAGAARKRLVENMQRADLTAIEEARGFSELCVDHEMTQAAVAQLAGRSQPYVANALRLLDLPDEVQQMVQNGKLTRAHGVALARFARWPKACALIATVACKGNSSSKDLERTPVPFSHDLLRAGLVEVIRPREFYSNGYTVPAALQKDPDFVKSYGEWHCFAPGKWAPEKKRQDEARAAAEQNEQKKQAAMVAKGGQTSAQLERARALERNKKRREQYRAELAAIFKSLAAAKAPTSSMVAVLATNAVAGGYYGERVKTVAEMLGLKLPSGVYSSNGHGLRNVEVMAKMNAADVARLAVGVILHKEVDDLLKNPRGFAPSGFAHFRKGGRK